MKIDSTGSWVLTARQQIEHRGGLPNGNRVSVRDAYGTTSHHERDSLVLPCSDPRRLQQKPMPKQIPPAHTLQLQLTYGTQMKHCHSPAPLPVKHNNPKPITAVPCSLAIPRCVPGPHTLPLSCCKHSNPNKTGKITYDRNQSISEFDAFIVEEKRKKNAPKIEPQAVAHSTPAAIPDHLRDLPYTRFQPIPSNNYVVDNKCARPQNPCHFINSSENDKIEDKNGGVGMWYGCIESQLAAEGAALGLDQVEKNLRKLQFIGGHKLHSLECCIDHVREMNDNMRKFNTNCEKLHVDYDKKTPKKVRTAQIL
ncbi:hypothetical protein WR25_24696 [Diploscapter pachys]|uniref:Uncharacterized protein n=1 Tax=Diploscapter pachys TaxID=2018661 RepID=A0A2A2L5N7_9BILA|nr:hypothetical protein WR25_24696 [Diploscapter pachys]